MCKNKKLTKTYSFFPAITKKKANAKAKRKLTKTYSETEARS